MKMFNDSCHKRVAASALNHESLNPHLFLKALLIAPEILSLR